MAGICLALAPLTSSVTGRFAMGLPDASIALTVKVLGMPTVAVDVTVGDRARVDVGVTPMPVELSRTLSERDEIPFSL